jgi:hypothetical protein
LSAEDSIIRPIIILGVDRSGTSLIAELVHRWGAYAGEASELAPGNEGNPQGYWEYMPMEDFLSDLSRSVGLSDWHPSFPELMRQRSADPKHRERANELVARMESAGRPWSWKEPYLCTTLPFWEGILKDPIYVIPVRNPHHSALSYEKFILTEKLHGKLHLVALFLLRWQHFMLSVLAHAERNPATLFIHYEETLRSPVEQCRRLADFLDRECRPESWSAAPDPERLMAMIEAINPRLWRHRSSIPFDEVPEATAEQKALYAYLQRKVEEPGLPFDPALYPLPAGGREYLENFDYFRNLIWSPSPAETAAPAAAGGPRRQGLSPSAS